jgi:hypothetical protein
MANKFTDAVFEAKLTGIRKLVLWALAHRADGNTGVCWPSFRRIAGDAGIGEQTAKDAVKFLLEAELIAVVGKVPVRDTQLSTNKYQLQLEAIKELGSSDKYAFKSQTRHGSRTRNANMFRVIHRLSQFWMEPPDRRSRYPDGKSGK